jgi:hypothetical protein
MGVDDVEGDPGFGRWAGGIGVHARVVLSAAWGESPPNVALRPVPARLSGRGDPMPVRPLRPLFPLRVGADGALAVLSDMEESLRTRRFLHLSRHGALQAVQVGPDVAGLTGWRVVDFRPAPGGGLVLLEFLENGAGEWTNRLRLVDLAGVTTWSRQGEVDFRETDPHRLIGSYTGLQQAGDGPLWLVPKATTAGLAAIDPADGRTVTTVPLDADISNLVVSAAGQAAYARMVLRDGTRTIVLATTDLKTGEISLGESASVPLLNLAGTDSQGRVYARTPDGMAALDPVGRVLWRFYPCGAVVSDHRMFIACGTDHDRLMILEYEASRVVRTRPIALGAADGEVVRLVAVEDGPRFVFHVTANENRLGRVITTDGEGHTLTVDDEPDPHLLAGIESRIGVAQSIPASDGAVLLPLTDDGGYRVLRLEPVWSQKFS